MHLVGWARYSLSLFVLSTSHHTSAPTIWTIWITQTEEGHGQSYKQLQLLPLLQGTYVKVCRTARVQSYESYL